MAVAFLAITSPEAESRVIYAEVDGLVSVEVDNPASKVFIGNPAIADIVVVSDRKFFILGRKTGQTTLIALDRNDDPLIDARVIVEPLKRHRVTVHEGDTAVVYSCGERCVSIREPAGSLPQLGDAGGDDGAEQAGDADADSQGGLSGGRPSEPRDDGGQDGDSDGDKAASWRLGRR